MELSDSGRKNFVQRVIVAAIGIPLVVGAVLVGGWVFALVVSGVAAVAAWEYGILMRRRGVSPILSLGVLGAGLQVGVTFVWGEPFRALGAVVLVVVLLAWTLELRGRPGSALLNTAAVVSGVGYIGGLLSCLVALRQGDFGMEQELPGAFLLGLLGAIWIGDSAAYAIGRRWGRRALAPRVSPRKTWEGAIACFGATALVFWLCLRWWVPAFPSGEGLLLGMWLGVVGQLGDLAESQLKRDVGVKDSSRVLPGHGGMLDRVDSLLFAGAGMYLWLVLRG